LISPPTNSSKLKIRVNEQVRRNIKRFPQEDFMFKLNDQEKNELIANCDRFNSLNEFRDTHINLN